MKRQIKIFADDVCESLTKSVNEFIRDKTTGEFDAKFTENVDERNCWYSVMLIYEPIAPSKSVQRDRMTEEEEYEAKEGSIERPTCHTDEP